MANPIADLQNEVAKRDISPEDVDKAMRAKFPESSFPYYAPPNGCSTPIPLPLNILLGKSVTIMTYVIQLLGDQRVFVMISF
ncbi:MAG: hypothetical protein HC836_04545 [Richelia sp. RM2_1_2]|nr:hypothetical protein [Richelia sp. SM1_7_0]NJO57654.1 hypothetical protein [Richelia sp. RM2_1_2]